MPFLKSLGEVLFPPFCCSCHSFGSYLCDYCYEKLEFFPMPIFLETLPLEEVFLDELICAVKYDKVIGSVLHYLKYKHAMYISDYLGDFLYFTTYFPRTDFISAIPIHKSRKNERGYNQSELIARKVSTRMRTPFQQFLFKKKKTSAQATLEKQSDRLHNLDDAFKFQQNSLPIVGKSILLIDDVCTTGTTLNISAKILKNHGATRVIGLTVAHGF